MSLIPQRSKFPKTRRPRASGVASSATEVAFGLYGLKVLTPILITTNQIEAVRKMISRVVKKTGRVWIRCLPTTPVTDKPSDVRMGGGKGPIEYWVANVQAGRVIFEVDGISEAEAKVLFSNILKKLPVSGVFVKRKFVNFW